MALKRNRESFTINIGARVRRETLNGRDYLVAPMTLIVPGVLSGSKGPLYYPADEVRREHTKWNNTPIVVNHPTNSWGMPASARDPEILEKFGIGTIFRSRITQNGKLKAEGWFDVAKTKIVDERVYNLLVKGNPFEISTGLFTDNHLAANGAVYDGRPYSFIARNYRPDHLAILPDKIGACSVKDGCGALVDNSIVPTGDGRYRLVSSKGRTIGIYNSMFEASQEEWKVDAFANNANPNHDQQGRFSSGGGSSVGGYIKIMSPDDPDLTEDEKRGVKEFNDYHGSFMSKTSRTIEGAVTGAVAGGGVGSALGAISGSEEGLAIGLLGGAALGGVAGGIHGYRTPPKLAGISRFVPTSNYSPEESRDSHGRWSIGGAAKGTAKLAGQAVVGTAKTAGKFGAGAALGYGGTIGGAKLGIATGVKLGSKFGAMGSAAGALGGGVIGGIAGSKVAGKVAGKIGGLTGELGAFAGSIGSLAHKTKQAGDVVEDIGLRFKEQLAKASAVAERNVHSLVATHNFGVWDETKHPRDKGKFSSVAGAAGGGSSGGPSMSASPGSNPGMKAGLSSGSQKLKTKFNTQKKGLGKSSTLQKVGGFGIGAAGGFGGSELGAMGGAKVGATIGSAFGPTGTVVGGALGSLAGGLAGFRAGHSIAKKTATTVLGKEAEASTDVGATAGAYASIAKDITKFGSRFKKPAAGQKAGPKYGPHKTAHEEQASGGFDYDRAERAARERGAKQRNSKYNSDNSRKSEGFDTESFTPDEEKTHHSAGSDYYKKYDEYAKTRSSSKSAEHASTGDPVADLHAHVKKRGAGPDFHAKYKKLTPEQKAKFNRQHSTGTFNSRFIRSLKRA